ncbi:MAG: TIR domain-containing protein [Candidatus Humimicrobiaceae bacterium]
MEKLKYYSNVRFNSEVIEEAYKKFIEIVNKYKGEEFDKVPQELTVSLEDETWKFDHIEEFLSMLKDAKGYNFDHIITPCRIIVAGDSYGKLNYRDRVVIKFPDKFEIDAVFNIFEKNVKNCSIKKEEENKPFRIFIGHGHDNQWRDLKDHLIEKHGYETECYEIGPKAGITIKDTLESMLNYCSFALLLFTGEDIDIEGQAHARENVIHELGLFQGRLGFDKAIILIEDGVKEFSNIVGLNQYRFTKGNIKEIFGDVVASINNELQNYVIF